MKRSVQQKLTPHYKLTILWYRCAQVSAGSQMPPGTQSLLFTCRFIIVQVLSHRVGMRIVLIYVKSLV